MVCAPILYRAVFTLHTMPRITASTNCYPTEDTEKVRTSLLNLFPGGEIEEKDGKLILTTTSGENLRQMIIDAHIRDTVRSIMLQGVDGDRIRFQVNKQAAFVGKISFAEGKTPLGTIEIEVQDPDIKGTIDCLAQSTVEVKE